jgi:hypothetical protein
VLAGIAAAQVRFSTWLLAFSMFLFLSLAFLKRFTEVSAMEGAATEQVRRRGYLRGDREWLGSMGGASGYLSVLVLALYINSEQVVALYRNPLLLWLVCPLLLFWTSRMWLLAHRCRIHDDPIVATVREGRHILQNIQRAFLYLIAFHVPIVALAIVTPLAGMPLVLLPIHLVWLELIVHPVSAFVFQAERATAAVMSRPPRDPAAPLLPRAAVARSAVSGGLLAAAAFATYWWRSPAIGELEARSLTLVVLIAGYQTLLFAERLAIPESVARVPRTPVFWTVWMASALSVVLILFVPSIAHVFRVALPPREAMGIAVLLGVLSVGWRLTVSAGPPTRRSVV